MLNIPKKNGQSTLEYVLFVTAVIAGIIIVVNTFLQPRVQSSLDHVTNEMTQEVAKIDF